MCVAALTAERAGGGNVIYSASAASERVISSLTVSSRPRSSVPPICPASLPVTGLKVPGFPSKQLSSLASPHPSILLTPSLFPVPLSALGSLSLAETPRFSSWRCFILHQSASHPFIVQPFIPLLFLRPSFIYLLRPQLFSLIP